MSAPSAVSSYTLTLLQRINDYQRLISETETRTRALKMASLRRFEASSHLRQLQVEREEQMQRVAIFTEKLHTLARSMDDLTLAVQLLDMGNVKCMQHMAKSRECLQQEKRHYECVEKSVELKWRTFVRVRHRLEQRQMLMIDELSRIFVIEIESSSSALALASTAAQSHSSTTSSSSSSAATRQVKIKQGKILNVPLKLANTTTQAEDHSNAIALGHVVHACQLVADILAVPLRCPFVFRSSRSLIIEHPSNYRWSFDAQSQLLQSTAILPNSNNNNNANANTNTNTNSNTTTTNTASTTTLNATNITNTHSHASTHVRRSITTTNTAYELNMLSTDAVKNNNNNNNNNNNDYLIIHANKGNSVDVNNREYALFKSNSAQSADQFPLAISLLNKNLSQLRIQIDDKFKNFDPNDTLKNLKWIFDYFKATSQRRQQQQQQQLQQQQQQQQQS